MFNIESSGFIGILIAGLVEVLKRLPLVSFISGHIKRIRTVAAVFAFLGNLATALADGNVDALSLIAGTIASSLVSYATYKGLIADPNKPVTQ